MGKSAIMSVRITGNSDDAVKALSKVTAKASAFGTFMGGAALKGVSALWDTLKGFTSAVMDMSDSTDKLGIMVIYAKLRQNRHFPHSRCILIHRIHQCFYTRHIVLQ